MTDDRVIDLGWMICKLYRVPEVFLWLEERGWDGAMHIEAIKIEPPQVHLKATRWTNAQIIPTWTTLN